MRGHGKESGSSSFMRWLCCLERCRVPQWKLCHESLRMSAGHHSFLGLGDGCFKPDGADDSGVASMTPMTEKASSDTRKKFPATQWCENRCEAKSNSRGESENLFLVHANRLKILYFSDFPQPPAAELTRTFLSGFCENLMRKYSTLFPDSRSPI